MKDTSNCYDMEGIIAQRLYDQNPEAQLHTKECMAILTNIIRENKQECKYAYYLRMVLVEGYSIRDIAKLENVLIGSVQERLAFVTSFIRREVVKLKRTEKKVA